MRRLLAVLQMLSGSLAGVLVILYCISRALTDRTHITQYLYWTPWLAYAIGLAILTCLAWLCSLPVRRRRDRKRRRWSWRLPGLALPLLLVHVAYAEWHAWRFVLPVSRAPAEKTLRVMHWNMTYAVPYWWDKYIAAVLKAPRPDVLIISNPTLLNDLPQLSEALGPEYKAVRCGIFGIFARVPIEDRTFFSLGIAPQAGNNAAPPGMPSPSGVEGETDFLPDWSPIPRIGSNIYDAGHAMYVRLDTSAILGRSIVIWAIDMPSEPRGWRLAMARDAARRLDELAALPEGTAGRLPTPDLILGDFNTPRGSASLGLISRGYPHAFDQAGRGHVASWPREWAMFHIDHIFVGPDLRATSYRTTDLGISEHRSQSAEITVK